MTTRVIRSMADWLKYLPLGFLALLILVNFYLGINKAVTRDPLPKFLGFSPLVVLSGSMEPAMYPGDVVIIREQAADKYRPGDVVTYLTGGNAFTHRIVSEENGVFTLKGDNNNTADEFLTADRFEGKVILRIPKIGLAIVFLKKPQGMVLVGALLVLGVYGGDLYRRTRKRTLKS
ncbi:MAG: signal peptidase I [Pelotomaculaceae bacterium]|jgi:signal peptidase|uniref:Signal peptidase I W n=1 Tax=anaerobic digester metagenome TaxID=1263854 RepID=A0A485M0G5_9ZZZZ